MADINSKTVRESDGRRIHGLADQAREEERYANALELADEAAIAYDSMGDTAGHAEVLSSKFLTLRQMYELHGEETFLSEAVEIIQQSITIAKESGDNTALAIPLFNLAKAQETQGDLPNAVKSYKEAVENLATHPSEFDNLQAVAADFKVHMTTCEYKAGNKSVLPLAEKALHELEETEYPDAYTKDVWVSGGYMRMADMLREDDPEKAQASLQKAKEIIDANPKLVIRARQWEKLAAKINPQ